MVRWFMVFLLAVAGLAWGPIASAQPRRRAPAALRAPERACVPGAQTSCACPNGGTGVQACNAAGSGMEPCRCLPAPGLVETAPPSFVPLPAPPPVAVVRPRSPPYAVRWYGWQPLLFDVGAAGISIAGTVANSPPVLLTGGIVSIFGAPATHLAHGRYGAAGLSFAMRALNVGLVALAARDIKDDDDFRTVLIVSGIWHVATVVADAWWLSLERVPVVAPTVGSPRVTGGGALVMRDGAALTVSGDF